MPETEAWVMTNNRERMDSINKVTTIIKMEAADNHLLRQKFTTPVLMTRKNEIVLNMA
jgi:hypothetical protein